MTSLRLLIIEDSEDDALLLVRELRKAEFDPDFVRIETPQALEAALDANTWDAVIADYSLPAFTGLDALRIIRARGLDLPFILVSGVVGEEQAVEAMKAGAHDYIMKGNYHRLAPALERELGDAAVRRERRQAEDALRLAHAELESRVAERTAELQAVNATLRDSRRAALNMMEDAVNARRQAEGASAERKRAEAMMRSRLQLSEQVREGSIEELMQAALDDVELFTGSAIGYFHFVNEDQETLFLQTWSTNTLGAMCRVEGERRHYPISEAGVWVDCLHACAPVIHNDYPALPHKKGLPDGHVPVVRDLAVPIVRDNSIVAIIGVGNKPADYTQADVDVLNEFASLVMDLVAVKRAQEALRRAHGELEQRVAQRTGELAHTVNELQNEIVEREKADMALRVSEKKFRTLFEETKDVIYIMSLDGRMLDINPAGVDLFGYTKEEFLSFDIVWEFYCDPADRERFLQNLLARGYVRDFDVCMRKKGGEPIHVLKSATAIRTDQGEIAGYRGIIHDVTQRKRLEQQLLQSQKMESIGLLAGGVAHDFNNLLTAISGYSQIIQEQFAAGDETLAMCIEQVLSASARAAELTASLLAFSRKQIINPYPVQVNDIVVSLSKLLTRIIGEDIELGTQLAGKVLTVMADRGQIDQVLINLATNARDAMPQGGRLLIRTEQLELDRETARQYDLDKGGPYALISVADSGHGMDRETVARIFEPFFTTKETGKGTGLGLSIIYGIVKQHNGTITVESEPGKGATFTVYLPLVEASADEAQKEEAPAPTGGVETILLAEDDPMVRKYMQKILEMAGYSLITARNGEEAVERFRENRDRIALVLCDVVMPKMNGKEVYDEIRAMEPQARFLFASGYNDEVIHTKGILLEEIEFIEKPVNRQALLAKLREMLDVT